MRFYVTFRVVENFRFGCITDLGNYIEVISELIWKNNFLIHVNIL